MVKVAASETPAIGEGLAAVTVTMPAVVSSAAGTVTCSAWHVPSPQAWLPRKVTASGVLPKVTVVTPEMNLNPTIVSWIAPDPATAADGESESIPAGG